jgi:hypothetical protein
MPRVGFKATIPVFERVKTFRGLDRAATVTGFSILKPAILSMFIHFILYRNA